MSLFDILKNALLAGLGAQEKVKEFIDELVKKGELSESQGAKLIKEWSEKAEANTEEISRSIKDLIEQTIGKMTLPSKSECDELKEKVSSLESRVAGLEARKSR